MTIYQCPSCSTAVDSTKQHHDCPHMLLSVLACRKRAPFYQRLMRELVPLVFPHISWGYDYTPEYAAPLLGVLDTIEREGVSEDELREAMFIAQRVVAETDAHAWLWHSMSYSVASAVYQCAEVALYPGATIRPGTEAGIWHEAHEYLYGQHRETHGLFSRSETRVLLEQICDSIERACGTERPPKEGT